MKRLSVAAFALAALACTRAAEDTGPQQAGGPAPAATAGSAAAVEGPQAPVATAPTEQVSADAATPPPSNAGRSRSGRPPALAGFEDLSNLHVEGTTTSEAPQIVVFVDSLVTADGRTTHDFGRVLEGAPNEHEFVLENVSDAPVAIARLNSTCKCTLGDLARAAADGTRSPYELASPIAPGEKLVVRAGLVTAEQRGRLNHAVTLIHASGGATRLELTADVVPFFTTEPAHGALMLGKLRRTESATGTLVVRTGDGRAVKLEYDTAEVSALVAPRLTPVEPDVEGRSAVWRLEVTVGPGLPETLTTALGFNLYADVERPDADPDELPRARVFRQRVAIGVTPVPVVAVEPSYASIGIFAPGDPITRSLDVEFTDDHVAGREPTVTIEFAPTQPNAERLREYLTAKVTTLDEGRNWRVQVDLAALPAELAGPLQGSLVLALDHPERSSISIPFSGLCRALGKP
jgi:hypothetical protein